MKQIFFRSTNRESSHVDFKDALLRGQAPDYGLYMPDNIPLLEKETIDSFKDMEYPEIACAVMQKFLTPGIIPETLQEMARRAYDFQIPFQQASANCFILWLTKGPTASFKDFAARMMAEQMNFFASRAKKNLTVLVATSGDTGSAIANAFHKMRNTKVIVLFPLTEVTKMQRKQMTTLGANIFPVAVRGKFDDCQAIVKRAFNDNDLKNLNLTSANSINFGRLLPQIVYYFYAFSRSPKKDVVFSVPSGNFGNLMGGIIAKKMGLPVKKFIAAVNENDEFSEFLKTGVYNPVEPSRECSSNAMNVGHPSNLARLFDLYGGWLTDERDKSGTVLKKGVVKKMPDIEAMRKDFFSYSVNEKEVDEIIIRFYENHNIIIEPHGGIGIRAAEEFQSDANFICLETADPAKFPEKIRALLKIEPKIPSSLQGIDKLEESFLVKNNNYSEIKKVLLSL